MPFLPREMPGGLEHFDCRPGFDRMAHTSKEEPERTGYCRRSVTNE